MKISKLLGTLFVSVLTIGALSLFSCGDDDSEESDNGVVGTWYSEERGYYGDIETTTVIFEKDGTGTIESVTQSGSYTDVENGTFTYHMESASHGTMTIKYKDSSYSGYNYDMYTIRVEGGTMYLYEDGDDLEFVLTKKSGKQGQTTSSVVGTWRWVDSDYDGSETLLLTFKKGGTGTLEEIEVYNGHTYSETHKVTYTMTSDTSGRFSWQENDSDSGSYLETFYFELKGNYLYVYESLEYKVSPIVFERT